MQTDHESEIFRCIFREANDAFFVLRPEDLRIVDVNPAAQRLTGRRRKQLLEMSLQQLVAAGEVARIVDLIEACRSTTRQVRSAEHRLNVADGQLAVQLSASRIHTERDTLALLVVRDVTHTQQLEEQLHRARRMEAIGRLSTGVAHEINNQLTIINGYAQVLANDDADASLRAESLQSIQRAGEQAATFTRGLLEFGSKPSSATQAVNLFATVDAVRKLLAPLIGDHIRIETSQLSNTLWIRAEPTKLEQMLVNLAVNARDAMPDGGRLSIETDSCVLERQDPPRFPSLQPGRHVVLRIRDTGVGMSDQVVERAFEPFFTTKPHTEGSGLGLTMVYATVRQCGGHIVVDSDPGKGTTFTIYFPATTSPKAGDGDGDDQPAPRELHAGSERVLVVEDSDSVRQVVRRMLERAGYSVEVAADGVAALQLLANAPEPAALVLTDYLMPGMRGDELRQRIHEQAPSTRVLFMSGCVSSDGDGEEPQVLGDFLRKPFTADELLDRVRAILDD